MSKLPIDLTDKRWGGYVPWFFRHGDFNATGNFLQFFERLSQRLYRLFHYNEPQITNHNHFGELVESKSLQRFRYPQTAETLAHKIKTFFDPDTLKSETEISLRRDPEYLSFQKAPDLGSETLKGLQFEHSIYRGFGNAEPPELSKDGKKILASYLERKVDFTSNRQPILEQKYYQILFNQRLGVLEVILTLLPKENAWVADLVVDIRQFLSEAQIMLDIDIDAYEIKLLEEPLLQKEVIDTLLPRLASKHPERAKEFGKAYHDMIGGKDFDEVFVSAFKTLEELAQSITKYDKFEFKEGDLKKYFPNLHSTIHAAMIKLNAHRGDKGAHAKSSPKPHEMRYLLFSIMNIALLLLDYEP